ncbi:hypothetical protein P0E70_13230, partial [Enterococcus faecalis]
LKENMNKFNRFTRGFLVAVEIAAACVAGVKYWSMGDAVGGCYWLLIAVLAQTLIIEHKQECGQ